MVGTIRVQDRLLAPTELEWVVNGDRPFAGPLRQLGEAQIQ